jgi:hypothetical protein
MKQVIRVEKPKNVIEHIKIVNNDIQNIFGSTLKNNSTIVNNVPSVYRLAQNYPNPFNPITTIKYELPKDSKVKLVVYDLLGREVKTFVNEIKSAGYYQIEFNLQNHASGVYFYRIEADDLKATSSPMQKDGVSDNLIKLKQASDEKGGLFPRLFIFRQPLNYAVFVNLLIFVYK